jgi:hypothetical protein
MAADVKSPKNLCFSVDGQPLIFNLVTSKGGKGSFQLPPLGDRFQMDVVGGIGFINNEFFLVSGSGLIVGSSTWRFDFDGTLFSGEIVANFRMHGVWDFERNEGGGLTLSFSALGISQSPLLHLSPLSCETFPASATSSDFADTSTASESLADLMSSFEQSRSSEN